jgi:hypothetical protein
VNPVCPICKSKIVKIAGFNYYQCGMTQRDFSFHNYVVTDNGDYSLTENYLTVGYYAKELSYYLRYNQYQPNVYLDIEPFLLEDIYQIYQKYYNKLNQLKAFI